MFILLSHYYLAQAIGRIAGQDGKVCLPFYVCMYEQDLSICMYAILCICMYGMMNVKVFYFY